MRTEALPRSSLSHSQHTDLQTQDEHPPANAPTPDPSSAWRTNRGEYTRRAPTMRREDPRASQTKIWPTPIALPRITWSRGEVRGGFSFCSKWSCSRSLAGVWKSESRTTKVIKWANVQFNIGWSFQHTVGKYILAPSEFPWQRDGRTCLPLYFTTQKISVCLRLLNSSRARHCTHWCDFVPFVCRFW